MPENWIPRMTLETERRWFANHKVARFISWSRTCQPASLACRAQANRTPEIHFLGRQGAGSLA